MVSLRDDASSLSVSKKKIICIDESHDISKQGQDALLKQTEQCPEHLVYEFCTTDPDKMSSTLRDRFMEFHVVKVSAELISQRLKTICEKEGIAFHEDALQVIAERSEGHVRSAVNFVEEIAYLGEISLENLERVSKDFEEHLCTIISNLGTDLPEVIKTYQSISSFLSPFEFYNLLLSLLSDATKLLYGYDSFSEKRKNLLLKIKEIHGFSLAEFLTYLITRDKYVEKIGIQSDLIVLHYKFGANNFAPRIQKESSTNSQIQTVSKSDPTNSSFSYASLSKLSIKDRNQLLRQHRKSQQKPGDTERSEIVPTKWPLPKEERPGNNFKDRNLSAREFSQGLVGGRRGEVRPVVNTRTG